MSMDPFVAAASHSPLLTTFAADVKTAGLTGELDSMEVNNADVICGNIQTANATVYIISMALIPMH